MKHNLYFQYAECDLCLYRSDTRNELYTYASKDIDEKLNKRISKSKNKYFICIGDLPNWSRVYVLYHVTKKCETIVDYTLYID